MLVILGNQLFSPEHLPAAEATPVFMAEDLGLCTYVRHHQQKIVLFLAAIVMLVRFYRPASLWWKVGRAKWPWNPCRR